MCDPKNEGVFTYDVEELSELILEVIPQLTGDTFKFLHFHSGEGGILKALAKHYPNGSFVGVEEKEVSIRQAERCNLSNLQYRLEEPCFSEEFASYDYLLLVTDETSFCQHQRLIERASLLLKEKGSLFVIVRREKDSLLFKVFDDLTRLNRWQGFFRGKEEVPDIALRDYLQCFSKASLTEVQVFEKSKELCFLDLSYLEAYLGSVINKIKVNKYGQYQTPWKDDLFAERRLEFETEKD